MCLTVYVHFMHVFTQFLRYCFSISTVAPIVIRFVLKMLTYLFIFFSKLEIIEGWKPEFFFLRDFHWVQYTWRFANGRFTIKFSSIEREHSQWHERLRGCCRMSTAGLGKKRREHAYQNCSFQVRSEHQEVALASQQKWPPFLPTWGAWPILPTRTVLKQRRPRVPAGWTGKFFPNHSPKECVPKLWCTDFFV